MNTHSLLHDNQVEDPAEELKRLRAEVKELRTQTPIKDQVTFKVGPKGGVSVYGLGRFPVTLYAEQWRVLFKYVPMLEQFILDNKDSLATKA